MLKEKIRRAQNSFKKLYSKNVGISQSLNPKKIFQLLQMSIHRLENQLVNERVAKKMKINLINLLKTLKSF